MSTSNLSTLAIAGLLGADAALMCGCSVLAPCPADSAVEQRTQQQIAAAMVRDDSRPVRIVKPGTDTEIAPEDLDEYIEEVASKPVSEIMSHSRWVEGNTLVSTGLPEMSIDIDPAFHFVGSTRYELLGEVAAEAFIFADTTDTAIDRKITVVFEGAMPESATAFTYSTDDTEVIAGETYSADALFAWSTPEAFRLFPERDSAIHNDYITSTGLTQPEHMLIQRFARTTNDDASAECIIAYAEDLSAQEFSESDLQEGGPWNHMIPDLETSLRERALASFTVQSSQ